jgi:hypothetical protein
MILMTSLKRWLKFINAFFKDNIIFEAALAVDDIYRMELCEKGIKPSEYREVKQTR